MREAFFAILCLYFFFFLFFFHLLHFLTLCLYSRPSRFSFPLIRYESLLDIYQSLVLLYPRCDHFLHLRLTCVEVIQCPHKNLVLVVPWLIRYPCLYQPWSISVTRTLSPHRQSNNDPLSHVLYNQS